MKCVMCKTSMFVLNIEIERDWRAKRYLIFLRHRVLNISCITVHKLQEALTTQNMLSTHKQYSWGLQPPIGEKYSGPMYLLKKHKTYGLWSGNCHTIPVVGALVPMSNRARSGHWPRVPFVWGASCSNLNFGESKWVSEKGHMNIEHPPGFL